MTTIYLITQVNAPIQIVFDVNRDIDIHQQSASKTNEKAIAGVTSGLINLDETVIWRGKHFGVYLNHKSRITAMEYNTYFVDEMEEGRFKLFKHEHFFEYDNGITTVVDHLQYQTPFGIFGKIFDVLFLRKHLKNFILHRNQILKQIAENKH